MKASIYARYSTDLQSDASIEDQIRLCKEHIASNGWALGSIYVDRSMSGTSQLRPGYQKLLEDTRSGEIELVVAEALDRLSRDQEHVAAFYKQMIFAGVRIVTLSEGEISELHVGLKGTMNALFLKDLAAKTRRGLRGRIDAGRSAGGISYGYDVIREFDSSGKPVRGKRHINQAEAAIVRRIFGDYAAGKSPRAIARSLNDQVIPGPSGRAWTASTIHGNRTRGTGLLNNDLYDGKLVWNRLRYAQDAISGRRTSKLNPEGAWITTEVPDLRIIEPALWDAVKTRQHELCLTIQNQRIRHTLNTRHRARYLLSGLLFCGVCGNSYALSGADRYACANHTNTGECKNPRTVSRQKLERRVFDGIREQLLAPEMVAKFIREFTTEWNERTALQTQSNAAVRSELTGIEQRISRILEAIEQGVLTPTTKSRLLELEAQKERLAANLDQRAVPPPAIHPNLAELCRKKVADLQVALGDSEVRDEAVMIMRSLISQIIIHPGVSRGAVKIEILGPFAALAMLKDAPRLSSDPSVRVSLVAGTGFEPVTFRL